MEYYQRIEQIIVNTIHDNILSFRLCDISELIYPLLNAKS